MTSRHFWHTTYVRRIIRPTYRIFNTTQDDKAHQRQQYHRPTDQGMLWQPNQLVKAYTSATALQYLSKGVEICPETTNMLGAIVGDIVGSTYENYNCKSYHRIEIFRRGSRFTDDSVLTLATADHFLTGKSYTEVSQEWGLAFPRAGYGSTFRKWLGSSNPKPYNSWGNGSAMRVSPVAWVANDLDWAIDEAKRSAEVTHNHPEGIKGAQAVAAAVYMARTGENKDAIRAYVEGMFDYDLQRTVEKIRPSYSFEVSCKKSVPEAIIAFLDSNDFEDAIRKAISLGGDSDTIACVTGSIAHAYYGTIPERMVNYCREVMDKSQLQVLDEFCKRYSVEQSGKESKSNEE